MLRSYWHTFALLFLVTTLAGQDQPVREVVLQKGIFNYLSLVAYSSNGARLAGTSVPHVKERAFKLNHKSFPTEDLDSRVVIWDVRSGNMIANLHHSTKGRESGWDITALAINNNGRYVATLQHIALLNKPTIYLWDLASGTTASIEAQRTEIPLKKDGFPQAIAFSPDGKYFVVAAKSINLFEIKHEEITAKGWTATRFGEDKKPYQAIAFSKDSKYLAAGTNDGSVKVWDMETRQEVATFDANKKVTLVDISANGSKIIAANKKEEVYAWDLLQRKQLSVVETKKKITSIAIAPDGSEFLLRSYKDEDIIFFDVNTGQQKSVLADVVSKKAFQTSMGYDLTGRYLTVSASAVTDVRNNNPNKMFEVIKSGPAMTDARPDNPDEKIEIFDLSKRASIRTIRLRRPAPNKGIGFNPDNTILYSLGGDNYFKKWDLINASLENCFEVPANLKNMSFGGGIDRLALFYKNRIEICKLSTFDSYEGREIINKVQGASFQFASAKLSIDKRRLIVKGSDNKIYVWDLEKGGDAIASLTAPGVGALENIEVSSRGSYVIGQYGRFFTIWQVAGQQVVMLKDSVELRPGHISIKCDRIVPMGDDQTFYLKYTEKYTTKTLLGEETTEATNPTDVYVDCKSATATSNAPQSFLKEAVTRASDLVFTGSTSGVAGGDKQVYSPDGKIFAWVNDNVIEVSALTARIAFSDKDKLRVKATTEVTNLAISNDGRFVASGGPDGRINLWNVPKNRQIGQILHENEKYVFMVNDKDEQGSMYYKMSRGNQDLISFRVGWDYYPFESFDLQYNRYDKILSILTDPETGIIPRDANIGKMIESYRGAYHERLKNAGVTEEELKKNNAPFPMHIENLAEVPIETNEQSVVLKVKASDGKLKIKAIKVWVNGASVYGKKGIDVSGLGSRTVRRQLEIPLSDGDNTIQLACVNEKGLQSAVNEVQVAYSGHKRPQNLHLIAIGVDKFKNPTNDLSFAVKDAEDIVKLFSSAPASIYQQKFIHTLSNEAATRENILALKENLKATTTEDVVVVFISTHGLRDNNSALYFATPDCDFSNPKEAAFSNRDLEGLIGDIPARKRVVFIDACQSGEVNPENVKLIKDAATEEGPVDFKSAELNAAAIDAQLESEFNLMKDVFIDTRLGIGANIISATGGTQKAAETSSLENGVFTYVFKNGLNNRKADLNGDGQVFLSELRTYLSIEVEKESQKIGNPQRPTNRTENISNDWRIW